MNTQNNKTILIVEDEAPIRKVLGDVLKKQNFAILEAGNGQEGVAKALGKHPDLILLDIRMPIMDGMEALKVIRKDHWGQKVPVIILTNLSADSEEMVQTMVAERPDFYLIKSDWKMDDVVKKVKEVLKTS